MKVVAKAGRDDIATVYIAKHQSYGYLEFAQSLTPPLSRKEKWVILVSSLYGCPLNCVFCDAGGNFKGLVSKEDIFFQINYILKEFKSENFCCKKLKIQFARMGEPSFNDNVLLALNEMKSKIRGHKIYPSLSTVGPANREKFFTELLYLKKKLYKKTFQLQFSIHTTDKTVRDEIIKGKKMDFGEISEYARDFFDEDGKKITLNFIYSEKLPVSIDVIKKYFDREIFLIKVTPVNPTLNAINNNLYSPFSYDSKSWFNKLRSYGYDVIVSVGEYEENKIGSNCGQYITNYLNSHKNISPSYTYRIEKVL
ncbi:MAG: radical SAM protein [Elusimicrobiota bacterium]